MKPGCGMPHARRTPLSRKENRVRIFDENSADGLGIGGLTGLIVNAGPLATSSGRPATSVAEATSSDRCARLRSPRPAGQAESASGAQTAPARGSAQRRDNGRRVRESRANFLHHDDLYPTAGVRPDSRYRVSVSWRARKGGTDCSMTGDLNVKCRRAGYSHA